MLKFKNRKKNQISLRKKIIITVAASTVFLPILVFFVFWGMSAGGVAGPFNRLHAGFFVVAACSAAAAFVVAKVMNIIIIKPLDDFTGSLAGIDFQAPAELLFKEKQSKEFVNLTKEVNNILSRVVQGKEEVRLISERLSYKANYDAVTGLRNFASCRLVINNEIQAARESSAYMGVYCVNIDKFADIADTLGQKAGDRLLVGVAQRLWERLGDEAAVGRAERDTFFIIAGGFTEKHAAYLYTEKIMSAFDEAFELNNTEMIIYASVGICIYPDDALDADTLIRNAEIAMAHAKNSGGNLCCRYESHLQAELQKKLYIENRLRSAVSDNCSEFRLYFQPKVHVNGEICGCEALVRWHSPEGTIYPNEFIPLAEETGLIIPLSEWILKEAFRCGRLFEKNGINNTVSVNIPAQVLLYNGFIAAIEKAAAESGSDISKLDIEITEGTLINDTDRVNAVLKALHRLGITISIDDFGTGYSSLSYLKKLEIDRIKIDRSFITGICNDEEDKSIVSAIALIAKSLNMLITAEGVENKEQYEYLKSINCDEIQGYYVSKPLACGDYIKFAAGGKSY